MIFFWSAQHDNASMFFIPNPRFPIFVCPYHIRLHRSSDDATLKMGTTTFIT